MENARDEIYSEVQAYRVNRQREIRLLQDTLIRSDGHVFIHGPRGVGKSFLMKIFLHDLHELSDKIFAFLLPIQAHLGIIAQRYPDSAAFPVVFLLEMVSSAWQTLLGRSYREVVSSIHTEKRRLAFEERKFEFMRQIFCAFREPTSKGRSRQGPLLDTKDPVKGKLKEPWNLERGALNLISQELNRHIDDFRTSILKEIGADKIVVICDEANTLPDEWQRHIMTKHLSLLSQPRVQFVFVADFIPDLEEIPIMDHFNVVLELSPFSHEHMVEFLEKRFVPSGYRFASDAIALLHEASGGNARMALLIARHAQSIADERRERVIGHSIVEKATAEYCKKLEQLKKNMPPKKT